MLKKQYKILKFLKKKHSYDEIACFLGYKNFIELSNSPDWDLFDLTLSNCCVNDNWTDGITGKSLVSINVHGLNELERHMTEQRRWRIPVVISIIALILSAAAIGLQLAQLLQLFPTK